MARILIAEDNNDLREFLTALLQLKFHRVDTAGNKRELLARLEFGLPDIIMLDIMLAGDDGREICREIKTVYGEIKIILMSANPALVMDYEQCNADAALEKPFEILKITQLISELTERPAY